MNKMQFALLILASQSLLFCAGQSTTVSWPAAPTLAPLLKPQQLLVFGELHGTNEAPAFVGKVMKQAAGKLPTTLALEIPHTLQPALDTYLQSTGENAAKTTLLGDQFWQAEYQDGRRSGAMFALVEQARRLRASGEQIRVLAMDAGPGASAQERDATMADRVLAASAAEPAGVVIALVGNLHSRDLPTADYQPMGYILKKSGAALVNLTLRSPGGTAWMCTGSTAASCGANSIKGSKSTAYPAIELFSSRDNTRYPGHAGTFAVGPITASPPARQLH